MNLLRVSAHATGEAIAVELPRALGLKAGTQLQVVSHGPDGVLLLREGQGPDGFFAGNLTSFGVAEVMGHLLAGVRTGKLIVTRGSARRIIHLRDGQLVFASSTESYERLGRSLVARGLVTAKQLEEALTQVKPGAKLGQVLTRNKVISAPTLYAAMADLVKAITIGLFELPDGHFLFFEGGPMPDDALKLPERTRDVILAGLHRGEEAQRLRQRYPVHLTVARGPGAPIAGFEALVEAAGRGVELGALQAGFEGSHHAFYAAVDELFSCGALMRGGAISRERPGLARIEPPSTLNLYAALIRTIVESLARVGRDLEDLQMFFVAPLPGLAEAFTGVQLADDGSIDVERVLANVRGADHAVSRARAYEALDAFVSYALFSAKNALPPHLALSLETELRRIQAGAE